MPPRVTICIPSRNTRPFLEERRDSILRQTFTDWNVVIVDDGSTDGSWQFFEEWAANDARVSLHQGPGQGLYAGWNDAIRRAEGEYVHIATSDDSMDPLFLQTMVAALDAHRDCWMAQCELVIIDEHGRPTDDLWQHVWRNFCPDLVGQFVIRRAPYDGILHYGLRTVYTSINQLLLRREAFSKAGVFRTDLGPTGDFEWGMRAGFLLDILHVPRRLAAWRRHPSQATGDTGTADVLRRLLRMTRLAYHTAQTYGGPVLSRPIQHRMENIYLSQTLLAGFYHARGLKGKLAFASAELLRGNRMLLPWRILQVPRFGRHPDEYVREALRALDLPKPQTVAQP